MKNSIWPNKETKIYISMANNPGNSGATLHNTLFKLLKLNKIYLPLKVKNIRQAENILNHFNFDGCSLSMPYKEKLIKFVDKIDKNAKKIGSINTLLKKNKRLIGFNTDYFASKEIFKKQKLPKNSNILILGCGGVGKAVLHSLIDLKFKKIYLSSRNKNKFDKIKTKKKIIFLKWNRRQNFKADVIVNSTPLGMFGKFNNKIPINISKKNIPKFIYDLTVNPLGNMLFKFAKKNKIKYISGLQSSYLQGIKQFEIYNNVKLKPSILKKAGIPNLK